jgi:2-succinyl-5-enolpyruvyl-6-hydroxy-3-cyclohexene-1-carboxylate synthase
MTIYQENLSILWGSLIVDELIRNSASYFCISPGSRSTPLTVAAARHPKAENMVIYDERSAAFHALGYARGSGRPAILICTSGTAIANYTPAVVEAAMDYIPMIILSADRPAEKIETGANQTIRQSNFFGDYVRWQFDLPSPNEEINPEMVLTTIDHAVYQATSDPRGPVHINCHFREPLAPLTRKISSHYLRSLKRWKASGQPYTVYSVARKSTLNSNIDKFASVINATRKGLLVVGRLKSEEEYQAVKSLSAQLNWPMFADILSGLRLGNTQQNLISYFDLMLLAENVHDRLKPDTILHLGEQPASKRFLQFVEKVQPENYLLVSNHSFRSDPAHRVTWRVVYHLEEFCDVIGPHLHTGVDKAWFQYLEDCCQALDKQITDIIASRTDMHEPGISRLLSEMIPESHLLFLSNSLPIREMDMFGDSGGARIRIAANRGVSGIDGTIASALGFATALNKPVTLLIGDLAFLHDLNSLALISSSPVPIIIILINNGGGGIFSFLPIAEFKEVFEPYFGTPHTFSFEHAAGLFHLDYASPQNLRELQNTYQAAAQEKKSVLIEVRTDRQDNYNFHLELYHQAIEVLEKSR